MTETELEISERLKWLRSKRKGIGMALPVAIRAVTAEGAIMANTL